MRIFDEIKSGICFRGNNAWRKEKKDHREEIERNTET